MGPIGPQFINPPGQTTLVHRAGTIYFQVDKGGELQSQPQPRISVSTILALKLRDSDAHLLTVATDSWDSWRHGALVNVSYTVSNQVHSPHVLAVDELTIGQHPELPST